MRTRAARRPTDSMDLLLDTICNTFGGILFIAILVILLLQTVPDQTPAATATVADNSPARRQQLVQELADRERELSRLREIRSGQQRTIAALASEDIQSLITRRTEREDQAASLESARNVLLTQLSAAAAAIENAQRTIAQSQTALADAKAELADAERDLSASRKSRVTEIRTPVARSPARLHEVQLLLQYGRMYVWHRYDVIGNRNGLNTDEFVVLESTTEGLTTTPRPTRGIMLEEGDECRRRISDRLRGFRATNVYLAIVVRPDSYGHFRYLRDAILQEGFEYRLIPADETSPIQDRGGEGRRVQ